MKNFEIPAPNIISGDSFYDHRGIIRHNNNFDLSLIKRIYEIENISKKLKRGWKGHNIQKRWFLCSKGKIQIEVININDLVKKNIKNKILVFNLDDISFDVLYVPPGYATRIKQISVKSRILVFADFSIDYKEDELRL